MKRTILSLALGLVTILTSCQKEDVGITSSSETVTLNVTAQDAFSTRSDGETLRYIMAKYSDASYTTLVDDQESNATGAFSIVVDKEQDYYILFWADRDASDVFDTDDLTSVSLKSGVTAPAEAWVGKAQITNGAIESSSITLGRAVAKINLMETGAIMADNTLKMSFTHATAFDLTTSAPSTTATASREESFTISTAVDGSTTNAQLNESEIYVFATQVDEEQTVVDITFQMTSSDADVDAEAEFTVGSVPLKANQATNIIGHYSYLAAATFTLYNDTTWWTFSTNEVEL